MARHYRGEPRTDLERFMRVVGATPQTVAEEIEAQQGVKITHTTIWRASAGRTTPLLAIYEAICAWADQKAKAKRLRAPERLRWRPTDEAA